MAQKGMSSKVLNMKFMRQAEIKAEEQEQEEQQRKLRDLSEWRTHAAEQYKARLLTQKPQVRTVGFQTLNQIRSGSESAVVGRRTFGEEPKKKETKEAKKNDEDDDSIELDKLWKKTQLGSGGEKKRINSGSKRSFKEEGTKQFTKKRKSQP